MSIAWIAIFYHSKEERGMIKTIASAFPSCPKDAKRPMEGHGVTVDGQRRGRETGDAAVLMEYIQSGLKSGGYS